MRGGFWCMFFGHKWTSYRPANAKHGDKIWYCLRCDKRVAE